MKILALVSAALAAVLLAAGCGGSSSSSSSSTSTTNAGIPTDSSTTAPKSIKVGLVTDIGQLNDRGFNHLAFVGLQRAEKQLGVSGRVLESPSGADYIPNLTTLAQQNYDLVIAVGFLQGDAVNAVSQKFPKTHFAIIDVDRNDLKSKPKNVVGLPFK
ncbi:MAG: BMP family lipoprotein, partial [Gaiellaceae bacterium]